MVKKSNKGIFMATLFVAGFVLGGVSKIIIYDNKREIVKKTYLTRFLKVDDLKRKTIEGKTEDYEYLKEYFHEKKSEEDLLYYPLVMGEKYKLITAYNDAYNSIIKFYEKYNLKRGTEINEILNYCKRKCKNESAHRNHCHDYRQK